MQRAGAGLKDVMTIEQVFHHQPHGGAAQNREGHRIRIAIDQQRGFLRENVGGHGEHGEQAVQQHQLHEERISCLEGPSGLR